MIDPQWYVNCPNGHQMPLRDDLVLDDKEEEQYSLCLECPACNERIELLPLAQVKQ